MDKMKFETTDLTAQNIDKIAALFPNCVTEMVDEEHSTLEKTVYKRAINFEILKQMLSPDVTDGDEAYEFKWVGKKAAIVEANKPIRKTLRPCPEESKNWDTTENLYVEGDNLEVLKLLQESYLGKVKMIYIDPPYNTGNDFIYRDDFDMDADEYAEGIGHLDEEGNRLFRNTDSNGRFHSDWCSMIYSRLMLARDLLRDDGVIFISIDDNEQENLKKICDEVFGESNFLAQVIWERAFAPINLMKHFSPSHDYILCYAKNSEVAVCNGIGRSEKADSRYSNPDNDPRGIWSSSDISVGPAIEANIYPITTPSGRVVEPPAGRSWSLSKKAFLERLQDNRIWFGPDGNGVPRIKRFLSDLRKSGITPMTIWKHTDVDHSQGATQKLAKMFEGKKFFDYPKPVDLIKRCVQLYSEEDSIILDFFSGSATTAHAVMQLNAEDGGHRKFIMVQLPEPCEEKSEAYKAGYKNICEIGKERIRRAGEKIKLEMSMAKIDIDKNQLVFRAPGMEDKFALTSREAADEEVIKNLDVGFRVLKLDDTNMKDVYYSPVEYEQQMLAGLESNIKEDRTDLDLLFGCLIDWGLPLSMPYKSEKIDGCTVHTYNGGDLIACFDENIPESVVKEIAKRKPLRAVFRDSGFASSPEKINVFEIFKLYMPEDAGDIQKRIRVI